ncbi:MAG: putative toxin-antitoxin system toxin component, PIN family [Thiobacillus sp.]|nr:putative toxin-antitoxin system toxin component, PIN family [Thiobacillus sp.]
MAAETGSLLVLDTNVVLDLLYFDDVVARPLRHALEDGRMRCVVTDATLEEWRRVLTYPEFALDATRQTELFARYQALSVGAGDGAVSSGLPRCSDPDDQKFIELAAASGAQGLVSKDHAVLKLCRRCAPRFRIMTPAEAVRWLAECLPEASGHQPPSSG